MTIDLEELVQYWQAELGPEREAEIEEAVFVDDDLARRLDAIAQLDSGIRTLVRAGRLRSGLTAEGVDALAAAGLRLRTYRLSPGEVVPCTIAAEDFSVLRFQGDFEGVAEVDFEIEVTFEGESTVRERVMGVPVDRTTNEIVLVYPGDEIRALPRSRFAYRVTADGRPIGEYGLDHTPPSR